MSKSRCNTIDLKDSAETVAKKVRTMYGGPPRRATEPGKVEANLYTVAGSSYFPQPGGARTHNATAHTVI